MKLVIDRTRWLRGEGGEASSLLRSDSKMCCLGFLAKACDGNEDYFRGNGHPAEVPDIEWPDGIITRREVVDEDFTHTVADDSGLTNELILINDDTGISDNDREQSLIDKFALIGVEVEFVN